MIKDLFHKPPIEMHEKPCSICGKPLKVDPFDQGECKVCGWYNSMFDNANKYAAKFPNVYLLQIDNTDIVIYPNLIPQNKAKKLLAEGKPFTPSLEDFLGAFDFYGEVCFMYKNKGYDLYRTDEDGIEFDGEDFSINFSSKEDFIANAKIGNEYVRDIWDKVEDPRYM